MKIFIYGDICCFNCLRSFSLWGESRNRWDTAPLLTPSSDSTAPNLSEVNQRLLVEDLNLEEMTQGTGFTFSL